MESPQITHPLIRHGTHQRERLADALAPGNLQLDSRSLPDLVAFVAKFAKHLRFWPTPADDKGNQLDWSCFWHKDITVLLAVVAATDVNSFRTRYRNNELAYYRAKKKIEQGKPLADGEPTPEASLTQLILCIAETAQQIAYLCGQIPASHPLKAEVIRIISDKLKTPLHRLIEFHKGVADRSLSEDYKLFIGTGTCQAPWGMPSIDDFFCIDVRPPQDTDLDTLWRLFLTFANALSVIVAKSGKAFQYALHSRSDHPPHVTLLLSFLNLFRYLQDDLNALPDKHLFYYYHDVLRLALRVATPDRAYLVFGIAQNIDQYLLKKGTQFLGGKDRLGLDRLYTLENELVINKTLLVEKKTLYFYKGNSETPLADPVADLTHPLGESTSDTKAWSAFGPKAVYQQINQKLDRLRRLSKENFSTENTNNQAVNKLYQQHIDQLTATSESIKARPGLIISSPELWMEKSEGRLISVQLGTPAALPDMQAQLSSGDTLVSLQNDSGNTFFPPAVVTDNGTTVEVPLLTILDDLLAGKIVAPATETVQIKDGELRIFLPPSSPALKPYAGKDEPNLTSIPQPFIRLQADKPGDYDVLRDSVLDSISLQTASKNVRNLSLQLGDTVYPSTAQLPLVGLTSGPSFDNLYVGVPEIARKNFTDLKTQLKAEVTGMLDSGSLILDAVPAHTHTTTIDARKVLVGGVWRDLATDPQPIAFSPTNEPPTVAFSDNSQNGFLLLRLNTPLLDPTKPITTDKILGDEVKISYASTPVPITPEDGLYYYLPFGGYAPVSPNSFALAPAFKQPRPDPLLEAVQVRKSSPLPQPIPIPAPPAPAPPAPIPLVAPAATPVPPLPSDAHGNMFLGFDKVVPGETLSLLFQMAEGTGNPDFVAPAVVWSYLRGENEWVGFPSVYILVDETEGLQQTGLITFRIPTDITNKHTTITGGKPGEPLRNDLYWLRVSATEGVNTNGEADDKALIESFPLLVDVHTQAGSVVFENHNNSLEHLEKGIPANTIAQLRFRDVNVRQVAQPYPSFGGRLPEGSDRAAYYRRISERLRHRQRAVTVWDYERLVLENFPKIALVKCLSHTSDDIVTHAGQITVAVVPFPAAMKGNRRFYPSVEVGRLTTIEAYLNQYNSFFVSGNGSSLTCSCHHDEEPADKPCGCQPASTLQVRNAIFEPVRLDVCVRFRPGKDPLFYRGELNKAIRNFLAPWAADASRPLLFGASVSTTQLLRFLETTAYVDVVTKLKVIHYPTLEDARNDIHALEVTFPEEIVPFSPRSVLTTYLNSLDEDNPNAIDHIINIIAESDVCACANCEEEEIKP